MSKKSEETRPMESETNANGVKKATTRKSRVPESKEAEFVKIDTNVGPYVRTSMNGKKFMAKMKSLKKKPMHTSYYDSDVDEYWVIFISLGVRFGH